MEHEITDQFLEEENDQLTRPVDEAFTLSSLAYASGLLASREQRELFSSSWQYLGPVNFKGGDARVNCLSLHGYPVIVTRDASGTKRCFHNVCRHRGGVLAGDRTRSTSHDPVAAESSSGSRLLRCGYHGWTYGLDGTLVGTPRCEGAKNFLKSDFSLKGIEIDSWLGFNFIHMGQNSTPQLKVSEAFAGMPTGDCPVDFSKMTFERSYTYTVNCNWKTYVDNYMEGYHVNMVHPELANILDTKNYKTEVYSTWSLQHSPIQPCESGYGLSAGSAHYYFLFPNMMLNVLPGRVQVNRVDPITPNQCEVIFDFYYDSDLSKTERAEAFKADFEFSDLVQKQDIAICEIVQKQLENGIYTHGRYNPQEELGLYHFHRMYRNWLLSSAQPQI